MTFLTRSRVLQLVALSFLSILACNGPWQDAASADVVVLANRTNQPIPVRLVLAKSRQNRTLSPGQIVAVPVRKPCQLLYDVSGELVRYQLDTNTVNFFSLSDQGWLSLSRVDLGGDLGTASTSPDTMAIDSSAIVDLPIKILVDNHDPRTREVWEKQLRRRVGQVSKILEQHCRLRLKIVAVDTWDSGNQPIEFNAAIVNFRNQVDPSPARLAIGFTGRYQKKPGRVHLGATHGMLQTHILIREWAASMTEPERVEVLLHEVGHYLGAIHSPDKESVMRPVLADDKAIYQTFRIGFDPVNTLLINLVTDDIRSRQAHNVATLSPGTRQRLTTIYETLLKDLPNDNSVRQYLSQLKIAGGSVLVHATRIVVSEVRRSAQSHHGTLKKTSRPVTADRLTEYYVRRAAAIATTLPDDIAPSAFLLGLGIALDDSNTLLRNPVTGNLCRNVETTTERHNRHMALGRPTLRGRRDLAQHFFLSAYLTAVVGGPLAESAGLAKELADARSPSGFSYRDLAADIAGISFAQRLLDRSLPLSDVAKGFATTALMPDVDDLPEGIPWKEIRPQLNGTAEPSVAHYRELIRKRVRQLAHSDGNDGNAVATQ